MFYERKRPYAIRQIRLSFKEDQFVIVLDKLKEIRKIQKLKTHTDVFNYLLEYYENNCKV